MSDYKRPARASSTKGKPENQEKPEKEETSSSAQLSRHQHPLLALPAIHPSFTIET